MDWDKLRIFHAVAEAGSFTRAGEALRLSQSAVSRQMSALEQSLKAPLFQRHARGLVLTEQGRLLYGTVHEVVAQLARTQALLSETAEHPSGPLTLTTTVGLGSIWLTPRIKQFIELHPEISVSLIVDDRELNLSIGEADIAIRMAPPKNPDLIQRHLMTVHIHVYGSPEYLAEHGTPKTPQDLDHHRLIAYTEEALAPIADANWLMAAGAAPGDKRQPVFTVNSIYGIFRAVQSGLGIASLPDYLVGPKSGVVQVLPELEGPNIDAYFVYPEALRNSKRVAVFRDFLIRQVSKTPF